MKVILKFALIIILCIVSWRVFVTCTMHDLNSYLQDYNSIEGFNSYQEACEAHRFDVAYKFLSGIDEDYKYNDAQDYILKQEIAYLISLGEEQHLNRVIFLLNTEIRPEEEKNAYEKDKKYNRLYSHYNLAFDLAESFNNDDLKEKLIPQFKKLSNQRIINASSLIEPLPSNNLFKGTSDGTPWGGPVFNYQDRVTDLNSFCLKALETAIKIGDETWANEIVNKMKPNVRHQIIKHNWEGDKYYTTLKLTYDDYEAINSAKQMLKDAKF